ncbi:hypothetical protein L9W92_09770 [Pelotomaculum terephthalicicum JT]|uniref:peptidase MA family metallohydrolase n=1 Tax=Pelotomaculum TaxID=191373 RepID=UPI0009D59F9B|nr:MULTISPECIES: peptidase MA family metallohydrolase [Pelotomaculum]MCG9968339.1 hypothetical protein [Pelotomaculum terephthalicicum JT]OPX87551.1 MAG: hypothetical protein A4E54_01614 [Pelotomaculum sp. PtaB.Bin117]OPY60789.1 MAG: hypothetical protein A4E56_02473 [Pelotomaculum sp. PtaU1.Bin065]
MNKLLGFFTTAVIIVTALFLKLPAGAKFYGYGAIRELMKTHAVIGTWGMDKISSEHFYIRFLPDKRAEAELVLAVAEQFYGPVRADFGYSTRGKIPIILYSSKEELNKSFGWEAKESAMGVYWAGTIRVLSPAVWAGGVEPERIKEKFISSGPMAHELTHLMVDYLTGGNYPRWFTEGVAQYEDYKLTGFVIGDQAGLPGQQHYSIEELEADFDSLPEQAQAYKDSFAAVDYIAQKYGEDALRELIDELGRGHSLSQAMENVLNVDMWQFGYNCHNWQVSFAK